MVRYLETFFTLCPLFQTLKRTYIELLRRTLASQDKKSFIDAVKCVRAKPSLYPPGAVPGSKSLYDDFIAVHLNQTLFIHLTVSSPIHPPVSEYMPWSSGLTQQ